MQGNQSVSACTSKCFAHTKADQNCSGQTCMDWMFASHNRTSCGSAYGLYIIIVQDNTILCKFVNVWCRNLVRPMKTYIIPTLKAK